MTYWVKWTLDVAEGKIVLATATNKSVRFIELDAPKQITRSFITDEVYPSLCVLVGRA